MPGAGRLTRQVHVSLETAVSVTQAWILVGVPTLVAGIALYTARSRWLGALGLLVLIAGTLVMATVDRISAAAVGTFVTMLYAAGRAGHGGVVGEDPVRSPSTTATAGRGDVAARDRR